MSGFFVLTCHQCGKNFKRRKASHNRQLRRGSLTWFCNSKCSAYFHDLKPMIEKECLFCHKMFPSSSRKQDVKKCCSRVCSAKYSANFANTTLKKNQKSKTLKNRWKTDDKFIEEQLKILKTRKMPLQFSSKGERAVIAYFKKTYPQYHWSSGGTMKFQDEIISRDLYCNELKVCFEYDGVWHFKDIRGQLEKKKKKDSLLKLWCEENDYRLIRVKDELFNKNSTQMLKEITQFIFNSAEGYKEVY